MHLSGSLRDRRCQVRIKNQLNKKGKLEAEKEQNEFILVKGTKGKCGSLERMLGRVLHIKVIL